MAMGLAQGSPGADIRRGVPPRSPPSKRQRKARLHARCKGRRLPLSNRFVPTSLVWSKAQLCIQSGKAQRPAERRAQQDQTREASKRLQQEVRGVVRLEVLVESKFPAPKQNRSEPAEEGVGLKAISPERAGKCPRPARVEGTSAQARKLAEPAQNDGRWFAVEVWIFEHSGAPATAPPRSACGIPVGRAPEHCGAGVQALRASRRRRRTISAHWQGPSTACGTAQRSQCFRP